MKTSPISAIAVLTVSLCQMAVVAAPTNVLNMYGLGAHSHGSAQQPVIDMLNELSQEHGFTVTHQNSQDAIVNINNYDVVVFNNTGENAYTQDNIRQSIVNYMTAGGKAIGYHASLDHRNYWDWWDNVMSSGAKFTGHDNEAFLIDLDPEIETKPALKAMWEDNDLGNLVQVPKTEIYVFNETPRGKPGVTMLMTVNEANTDDPDHPSCWVKTIGEGEFIYTGLGHGENDYTTDWMKKATWAWMKYLTGDYDIVGVDGKIYQPFARLDAGKDHVHIKDNGRHSVRIFDLQGRLRYDWIGNGEMVHAYQGLEAGVYYLQVKSEHLNYTRLVNLPAL